jgi:UDP-glucose 4-epimerase
MFIIVGGSGFLGSHLRVRLAALGNNETIIVSRGKLPFPASANERSVSAAEFAGDAGAALVRRAGVIVYLATASTVATFVDAPWQELSENVAPFMQLLDRVGRTNPTCKLVFVSSGGTIYGTVTGSDPIGEDHPRRPISPYGLGKLMQEEALLLAARTTGLGYNILRIANPVGVYGRSLSQGLVTVALHAVSTGQPIRLYGDGSHIRDILDADDAADAIAMAMADNGLSKHVWNIGSGVGISNREVLNMVERVTKLPVPLEVLPPRDADVPRIVLDTRRAREELGWQPTRQVEDTIDAIWHQNYGGAPVQRGEL